MRIGRGRSGEELTLISPLGTLLDINLNLDKATKKNVRSRSVHKAWNYFR